MSKRVEIRLAPELVKALDDYCDSEFISRSAAISQMIPVFLQSLSDLPVNVTDQVTLTGKATVNVTEKGINAGPLAPRAPADMDLRSNGQERRDPGARVGHTPKDKGQGQDKAKSRRKAPGTSVARGATERVIGRINELRPAAKGFGIDAWVKTVARLLKAGHTVSEILEVIEWRGAECRASGDWTWFKPDTLMRRSRFAGYLDNARAGVDLTGTRRPRSAGGDRAARFSKQRGPK